ncbi:MAG: protein translocase subunit SecF [Acidimicrobiales bacterium]
MTATGVLDPAAPVPDPEEGSRPVTQPKGHFWSRLYRGETALDFVGRRRRWFALSALVIIAGMTALGIRGINFGIDFKGGYSWQVPDNGLTIPQVKTALGNVGHNATIVTVGNGKKTTLEVESQLKGSAAFKQGTENSVSVILSKLAHVDTSVVTVNSVGPTWGGQVTNKAVKAVIIFFIAIGLYITIRFEWKMAVSAIVAVLHDLLVTVGIYALVGFPVTPDTVVAVLTILGYSLYDTIVVFDRVKENAKGIGASGKLTYSDTVNLSMNQVLMRSLNTSIVAILPILSILVIGAEILGATTLQEFGLALVIGLTSGVYSSIFIASPLLAILKEREPRFRTIRERLARRGQGPVVLSPAGVIAFVGGSTRPGTMGPRSETSGSAGSQPVVLGPSGVPRLTPRQRARLASGVAKPSAGSAPSAPSAPASPAAAQAPHRPPTEPDRVSPGPGSEAPPQAPPRLRPSGTRVRRTPSSPNGVPAPATPSESTTKPSSNSAGGRSVRPPKRPKGR